MLYNTGYYYGEKYMISWQSELLRILTEKYQKGDGQWVDIDFSINGKLMTLTIVSKLFYGKTQEERQAMVKEGLKDLVIDVPMPIKRAPITKNINELEISILSRYYTVEEAIYMFGNKKNSYEDDRCIDWSDMANCAVNPQNYIYRKSKPTYNNVDVYYSYRYYKRKANKLYSNAYKLAEQCKKVVIIDFCFESPELNPLVTAKERPKLGTIKYFYDRIYGPEEYLYDFKDYYSTKEIEGTYTYGCDFYKKTIKDIGVIYTFDSSILNLDYTSCLEDINPYTLLDNGFNLWNVLDEDIYTHIKPDHILVNAPSGLSKWTALLVTQAADKLVLFQNKKTPNDPMIGVVNRCFDVMELEKETVYYNRAT